MKHQSKLSPEQQQEAIQAAHETQQQSAQEFTGADEMLRFDAAHTAVPPQIADRLKQSAGNLPPPPRSWWKNLFG